MEARAGGVPRAGGAGAEAWQQTQPHSSALLTEAVGDPRGLVCSPRVHTI